MSDGVAPTVAPLAVLLVHAPGEPRGGVEVYLDRLAHTLTARGHRVERAARWGAADPARFDAVHVHDPDPASLAPGAPGCAPDVVTVHDLRLVCPGANRLDRSGHPCGRRASWRCSAHAVLGRCDGVPRWPHGAARRVATWSAAARRGRRAPCVVTASRFVAAALVEHGWSEARLHVLPYPVELPSPAPGPASGRRSVLFAGRLVEPDKGVATLLAAAASLPLDAPLVVAGAGPARDALTGLAARLGVGARVRFTGALDRVELRARFEDAALVVLPSRWPEPSGLVGLEALAHARPVVASAVGGVPEWLADGVVGRLVPPGDPAALADAIGVLLADPVLRDRMGAAGRASVAARHAPSAHVAALERLYETARGARRRRWAR